MQLTRCRREAAVTITDNATASEQSAPSTHDTDKSPDGADDKPVLIR
jgi:hypothetical protein